MAAIRLARSAASFSCTGVCVLRGGSAAGGGGGSMAAVGDRRAAGAGNGGGGRARLLTGAAVLADFGDTSAWALSDWEAVGGGGKVRLLTGRATADLGETRGAADLGETRGAADGGGGGGKGSPMPDDAAGIAALGDANVIVGVLTARPAAAAAGEGLPMGGGFMGGGGKAAAAAAGGGGEAAETADDWLARAAASICFGSNLVALAAGGLVGGRGRNCPAASAVPAESDDRRSSSPLVFSRAVVVLVALSLLKSNLDMTG